MLGADRTAFVETLSLSVAASLHQHATRYNELGLGWDTYNLIVVLKIGSIPHHISQRSVFNFFMMYKMMMISYLL